MSKRSSRKHLYAKRSRAKSRAAAPRRTLTPRSWQAQVTAGAIACALLVGGGTFALGSWAVPRQPPRIGERKRRGGL